jgi:aspartyl-tRNA(Asn)/glutamyl-tRNA(Gln) amidotransferase subunit A
VCFPDWRALDAATRRAWTATAAQRARRLEPRLNAFFAIEDDRIVASPASPLAGCPYAAKDIFAALSRRPTGGLATAPDFGLAGEAEVLRRLDQAGACRIGFTALTELAYEPSGHNGAHGRTRNPWNLDHVTGGSSSGSAAAVASGSAVFALGSDTGGSVRIPAHCCGVTGWKPTYGLVSTTGAMALAPSLDVIGVLARSAADLEPTLGVLAAEEPLNEEPIATAVVLADAFATAEPSVRAACQHGCDAIETIGVRLTRIDALKTIERIDAHALIVMQAEAAQVHPARLDDPALDATLRKRLAKGLAIDAAVLAASRAARRPLSDAFIADVLGKANVAVLPVMPIRTPPASDTDPASPDFRPRSLYELSRFTRFVNLLGLPAVALPVGFDDRGLPVALQIVGRPGSDRALVALAKAMQATTDWHSRVPAAVGDLVTDIAVPVPTS